MEKLRASRRHLEVISCALQEKIQVRGQSREQHNHRDFGHGLLGGRLHGHERHRQREDGRGPLSCVLGHTFRDARGGGCARGTNIWKVAPIRAAHSSPGTCGFRAPPSARGRPRAALVRSRPYVSRCTRGWTRARGALCGKSPCSAPRSPVVPAEGGRSLSYFGMGSGPNPGRKTGTARVTPRHRAFCAVSSAPLLTFCQRAH